MPRVPVALLLALLLAAPASAQSGGEAGDASQQPDLFAFWMHAGLFRSSVGTVGTVGPRLAANLGEETFVRLGAQAQSGGITTGVSRTSVDLAIGRSVLSETGVFSASAGPMVAWSGDGAEPLDAYESDSEYLKLGVRVSARGDLSLFYGVGVGLQAYGDWVPGDLAVGAGLSLTFGGFER
jgi:hypothetical protein